MKEWNSVATGFSDVENGAEVGMKTMLKKIRDGGGDSTARIRSAFRELNGVDVRTTFARQGVVPRMLLHRKPRWNIVQRV